jgi:outer membrane protein assembly factor BamD (BamD/ComL family)
MTEQRNRVRAILVMGMASAMLPGIGCQTWDKMRGATAKKDSEALIAQTSGPSIRPVSFESAAAANPELAAKMDTAQSAMDQQRFADAESIFSKIADDTKNPPLIAERARFLQGEALFKENNYRTSADVYSRLLKDFPTGVYREQAVLRMYDIADFWLKDTWKDFEDQASGKKSWVPKNVVNLDKSKPLLDQEGRALELLEKVHVHDPLGPASDKALFRAGYVHFHRGHFQEADELFTQLIDLHPKSEFRNQSIEFAIMAKNNSTGGPSYDGRKSAEALRLLQESKTNGSEDAQRAEFLDRQVVAIRHQQADKDFQIAEFYERTGHAGSAYFYYEIVRMRYPGTRHEEMALERMRGLRSQLQQNQATDSQSQARRWFKKWILGRPEPEISIGAPLPDLREGRQSTITSGGPQQAPLELPKEVMPRQ